MLSKSIVRSLALVGLLGASGVANAFECGELSPRLVAFGDAYYNVGLNLQRNGNVIRAKPMKAWSKTLMKALDRDHFREGSGTRHESSLKKNDSTAYRSNFELNEISVRLGQDDFILRALEEDKDARTVKGNSLNIPLLEHELTSINKNELIAHRRQRHYNEQTGFTFFREIELKAVRSKSGISVTQTLWMNGELAETTVWNLES